MIYPVRCTNVISHLMNSTRYKKAHFYKYEDDMFIDVYTRKEADLIARFNGHMTDALDIYQIILNNK